MDAGSDLSSFDEEDFDEECEKDALAPYQNEPCFDTKQDLENFMKTCEKNNVNLSVDSEDENVDTANWVGLEKNCTCGLCDEIKSGEFQHLCCQQVTAWKTKVSVAEKAFCLTKAEGFKMATNMYAARNLVYQMLRRKGRRALGNENPSNRQMRFGFYRSAHLFIGDHFFKILHSFNALRLCKLKEDAFAQLCHGICTSCISRERRKLHGVQTKRKC